MDAMSDDMSSFSTLLSSLIVESSVPKMILRTTMKLNDSNYLLWAQAFYIFIGAQNKLTYLLQSPLAATDPTYATWIFGDYWMMTWLLNNLGEKISGSVTFLTTAKEMWDTLKIIYGNEKNLSRIFEIYECLFELKGLIDELKMH